MGIILFSACIILRYFTNIIILFEESRGKMFLNEFKDFFLLESSEISFQVLINAKVANGLSY